MTEAFSLDPELAQLLRAQNAGQGIHFLLALRGRSHQRLSADHPVTKLLERKVGRDGLVVSDELLMFDHALNVLARVGDHHAAWCSQRGASVWSADTSESAGALSELEAFGTLLEAFPACSPNPTRRHQQTPDLVVPGVFAAEVYRPRESEPNALAVSEELDRQTGLVRLAVSYPITGSGGLSLEYPANKVVDRILNAKRSSRQLISDLPNVLYVDLRHEWGCGAEDLLPFRTCYSKGVQWIGTHGAWHAFYGATGRRTMLGERAALLYLRGRDAHEQQRNGLFRDLPEWSAAIVALSNGLVLFENPWARRHLADETVLDVLRLHRFRAETSWYRAGRSPLELERDVEGTLVRMEWTFRPPSTKES